MTTSADALVRAVAMHQRGDLAAAERLYREILAVDPSSALAAGNLGALLQSQFRADEAVFFFEQALAIDPIYAPALCNLGSIYKDQGQQDRAIDCYRRAIRLRPDMAEAHFN